MALSIEEPTSMRHSRAAIEDLFRSWVYSMVESEPCYEVNYLFLLGLFSLNITLLNYFLGVPMSSVFILSKGGELSGYKPVDILTWGEI